MISTVKVHLECRCLDRNYENNQIKIKNQRKGGVRDYYPLIDKMYLQITEDGRVHASPKDKNNPDNLIIIIVPVGIRQVAFLHEKTSLYIAMDQNSKVYSSVRISSIG